MKKMIVLITHRMYSLGHALNGLAFLLKTQPNARLHALATVSAVVAGAYFGITPGEWGLIVFAITAVWMAEAFNTALELLADVASPEFHPLIKHAKDVAAGAVLIAAMGAFIIGMIVFGPYTLDLLFLLLSLSGLK